MLTLLSRGSITYSDSQDMTPFEREYFLGELKEVYKSKEGKIIIPD